MMEETNRTFTDDEGEETMVSPRFDDEETVLARPVVPLEEVKDAPAPTSASAPTPPLYSRLRAAPRRSLVAALVLISVLVGSALGVAGLYFYQKHRSDDAPATAEQQQQADVPAPNAAAQATPEPESQARETNAHAAEPSAPAPAPTERDARAEGDAVSSKSNGREEAVAAPVVERRNVSEGRDDALVNPKRGKKGERDEEPRREARRENRDNDDDQPVRADDGDDHGREARRVGVITYRPRRVRTRRDNYGNADRLRRIFEGQP